MRSLRRARASRDGLVVLSLGVVLGVLAVLALGSSTVVRDQVRGIPEEAARTPSGLAPLTTVEWSARDGEVTVLVQNVHDQALRHADAVITLHGLDEEDDATRTYEGSCCEAIGVAPGATVGFSLDLGSSTEEVTEVEIGYRNVAWALDAGAGWPAVTVSDPQIVATGDPAGAAVAAEVASADGVVPRAVVQAVVEDADGALLTVVTGEWSCLRPDEAQGVRMPMDVVLPAGARLRSVETFTQPPPPPGAVGTPDACAADA